mmetsp:Transcript_6085/g.8886  ORF Transcript_6085/g.8886 Transcript_6085/m.8886 type:complete len:239 (-) Transcript_6085:1292-2008(-)
MGNTPHNKFGELILLDGRAKFCVIHRSFTFILFEVVYVHLTQLLCGLLKGFLIRPCMLRIKNLRIHPGQRCRDFESKDFVFFKICSQGRSVQNGIYTSSSVFDTHALTNAISTTSPSSVNKPSLRVMLLQFFGKQICIDSWVKSQKSSAKACTKRSLWLLNTKLSTGDLCSVTTKEMIHGLIGAQLTNWWKYSKCIACKKQYVLWVTGHLRYMVVVNMENRVRDATVWGFGDVVVSWY